MPDAPAIPDFQTMIDSLAPDGAGWRTHADEGWAQGRTLFGGMTAALAYAAARRALGDLGPLRSAQFAFPGPAAGGLAFTPMLLRRGRSSAVVAVEGHGEDGLAARATLVFAGARDSAVRHDRIVAPDVPPPEDCEPFHTNFRPLPGFLGRFDYRFAGGTRLFTPDAPAEFAVWVRFRDGAGADPMAALLAISDAPPGAAMAVYPKLAPISTMTWQIDVHHVPAAEHADDDGWRLVWSSSEQAAGGYSAQAMRTFDRHGRALASARQLVAVFA